MILSMSQPSFRTTLIGLISTLVFALTQAAFASAPSEVPFPRGYREWTHVKMLTVFDKKESLYSVFPGLHHVYANAKAVQALKSGQDFPDGSVLVLDLFEISDALGAISEGPRKLIAVMHRDSARYATTGGWGFEIFEGGNKNKRKVQSLAEAKACLSCHQSAKHGQVFSELSD